MTVLNSSGNSSGAVAAGPAAGGRNPPAHADNATYFDYPDWPGTERMRATTAAYAQDICTSLPYGADLTCTGGTDYSPKHCTGQVRDAATSLDHFPARNYTSAWGLWTTPDWSAVPTPVPYASFSDPQSLDLYAYTLDNPETNTDPDGHWCLIGIGTTCAPKKVKGGPKLAGPDWMTRCEGNSICEKAILAGLVQAALAVQQARQLGQSFKEHPWLNGALFGLSAFVGPEAEEGGEAIEEAGTAAEGADSTANVGTIVAEYGTEVSGITEHGVNCAIGDGAGRAGTTPHAILDALRSPERITQGVDPEGRPFKIFFGRDARVVVNPETGRVVSVNPLTAAGPH